MDDIRLEVHTSYDKVKRLAAFRRKSHWQKKMYNSLIAHHKVAIGEHVIATALAMGQDTRMSVATLVPLAKEVHVSTRLRGIQRKKIHKRKGLMTEVGAGYWNYTNESYADSDYKYEHLGPKQGIKGKMYDIKEGSYKRPVFRFWIKPQTFQHILWEPVWESMQAGHDAYVEYLEASPFNLWQEWENIYK